jgi:phosphatidylinositol alpha-1,6-mannosyltransferase
VSKERQKIIGFFPEFRNGSLGGIQESARIAWQAIENSAEGELVCHNGGEYAESELPSKLLALFQAMKRGPGSNIVLVWQSGLLKLLPFSRATQADVVVYLHGIEVWKKPDWLTERLFRRVNLFLSNSEFTWRRFLSFNPALKNAAHRTVALGINEPINFEPPPPDSPPAALVISRLRRSEDYKGHRQLISAWSSVLTEFPAAELWIVGEGDLRAELEELSKQAGVETKVKFLGRVTEAEKEKLICRSRCLAMPSLGEGFGLVYLEAMRLGRPCLVSTIDAGREVVDAPEAGLAVNPDEPGELTAALVRLLSDGAEWQRWSKQARQRYEENFTARQFQDRLLAALPQPASESPNGR